MPDYMHGPSGPCPVKRLPINITGTGDLPVIPAVTGKKFRVLYLVINLSKSTTLTVKSGAVTLISGPMDFAANDTISFTSSVYGLFETAVGEALMFNITGQNVKVGGFLTYAEF